MIAALRRVLAVPGVVLGVWIAQALVALGVGGWVRQAVAATMGPHVHLPNGHLLHALVELASAHPGIAADARTSIAASAIVGGFMAVLLCGGIFVRVAGQRGFWAACGRHLPGVTAVTAMHLVVRALLLVGMFAVTEPLAAGTRLALLGATAIYCTFSLDVTRARIVLDRVSPRRPTPVLEGFLAAFRWPRDFLHCAALSLAQYACLFAVLAVGIGQAGHTPGTVGPLVLSFASVLLGMWRYALVAHMRRTDARNDIAPGSRTPQM